MKPKYERRDSGRVERELLASMITDRDVLAPLAGAWEGEMFASPHANLVGAWCVQHFRKYGEAPGKAIYQHYQQWAERGGNDEAARLVEQLLAQVPRQPERESSPAVEVDRAGRHFSRVRLQRLQRDLEQALDAGRVDEAEKLADAYQKVNVGKGAGVHLFTDREAVLSTFVRGRRDLLVQYPGDLGRFFGSTLRRGAFVSFLAPDKTGKSFWLQDIAFEAMCQRRRVAYFELGDLGEEEVKERLLVRAAGHPYDPEGGWPCEVSYPVDIRRVKRKGKWQTDIDSEKRAFASPLPDESYWHACQRVMSETVRSKKSYFVLQAHPTGTFSADDVRGAVASMARQGWVPDVVVLDYADILAPPQGTHRLDYRHQVARTWEALRALALECHCLVVTATQSNSAAYGTKLLSRVNFSEDKRKLAVVTGMVGINVTDEEKEVGLSRLNWVVRRRGEYSARRVVYAAGCLAIGRPAICSVF